MTGTFAWLGWDVQRESRMDDERMLTEFTKRGADLEELQQRETEARAAMEQLQHTIARGQEVAHAGVELAGLLEQVRAGLGADTALLGLRLVPSDGATKVEIEGEASPQPIVAAASIARAARALEASPLFEGVEVHSAPLPISSSMPVHFLLSARTEPPR
ncbi:MAG: hypothetical protein HZA53_02255 [Planctomycetes bacterium]|nr:hypothetical protein [Planctomycetota bacterium]